LIFVSEISTRKKKKRRKAQGAKKKQNDNHIKWRKAPSWGGKREK